jgi:ubiquinone/menaquinone biosynthesis C-methylase UbiE
MSIRLKETAVEYFQSKAAIYNERYSVSAEGELVWVRHRAILGMVQGWELPEHSRLLDVGCGPGILTRDLARMGYRGVGIDASPVMIQSSKELSVSEGTSGAWSYQLGDVESLPFPDRSFDAAICSGVIDYLPTDDKLLAEVARVVKPGGRFIVSFTNKIGYTVMFSTPLYWLKKIPVIRRFSSYLRVLLVGGKHGAMEFNFLPRKHRASIARESLLRHGFRIQNDKYVHFSLLPAPLCALMSRLHLGIDERLGDLDRTFLRKVGSCYILDCVVEKQEM